MPDRKKIGRNNRARGKSYERTVAKKLGRKRNPELGSSHVDIDCPPFGVEVKSIAQGGKTVLALFEEAVKKCRLEQVPTLVLVIRDGGKLHYLAVQDLHDWIDWNVSHD